MTPSSTRRFLGPAAAVALLGVSALPVDAGIWKVGRLPNDCNGPCNFCDTCGAGSQANGGIKSALTSTSVVSGDTVLVWPGTQGTTTNDHYTIDMVMKSGITLIAFGYPDSTVIIKGQAGAEPALRMTNCNPITRVIGFTFTWNSQASGTGGGIGVFTSSGVIRDNTFLGCQAGIGAGVYLQTSDVVLQNNLFLDCVTNAGGGVIAVSGGSPTVINNTVARSVAPPGADGAAVYAVGTDFSMSHNIVYGSEGAPAVYCGSGTDATVTCNLFWANQAGAYGGQCSDQGGANGNFTADPLFCDPAFMDDGMVCSDSPARTSPCGPIGFVSAHGGCPSCAATSVGANLEALSWGNVKARYR